MKYRGAGTAGPMFSFLTCGEGVGDTGRSRLEIFYCVGYSIPGRQVFAKGIASKSVACFVPVLENATDIDSSSG